MQQNNRTAVTLIIWRQQFNLHVFKAIKFRTIVDMEAQIQKT